MISRTWEADPTASFARRWGQSPQEPRPGGGVPSEEENGCPDMWEMSNGDVAVIGRDLTDAYRSRLPDDVRVRADERLVIIPRRVILAAKVDIPDA